MQSPEIQQDDKAAIICEPDFNTWPEVLSNNLKNRNIDLSLRHEIIAAALNYTNKLITIAEEVGFSMTAPATTAIYDSAAIIMAGHQPVIYHAGLLRKNIFLQEFSQGEAKIAINLVIDLDDLDGGLIKFPQFQNECLTSSYLSIAEGSSLLKFQKIKSRQEQEAIWSNIFNSLKSADLQTELHHLEDVKKLYLSLAGVGLAQANSIVRAILEPGRNYLELPLSHLVQLPKVQQLINAWCKDGEALHNLYNSTLASHRQENGIKSNVNPFPDLKTQAQKNELPFWFIDEAKSRRFSVWKEGAVLYCSDADNKFEKINESDFTSEKYLSPRGALVSLLYRGFCSDFFIHGLGGRTYDSFTDRLAPKLISRNLPKFVVASETRYLYPSLAKKALEWETLERNKRDIISHTEKYFHQVLFSDEIKTKLKDLLERKNQLIPQLAAVKIPAERVPLGQALKLINDEIREAVDKCLLASRPFKEESTRNVWLNREYPVIFK